MGQREQKLDSRLGWLAGAHQNFSIFTPLRRKNCFERFSHPGVRMPIKLRLEQLQGADGLLH
jgi:hypothetical protein